MFFKRLCVKHKVKIVILDQPVEDPIEKFMNGIMDLMDEFYSMNIGLEVRKILNDKAKEGFYNGGKVAIGYKLMEIEFNNRKEKVYTIDEETAPVIRNIYNMYLENEFGISKITQYLNEHKIMDKKWSTGTVRDILKNPVYAGEKVWNRRETKRISGRYKDESEWVVGKYKHPAIVSKGEWELVQKTMAEKNKNPNEKECAYNPNTSSKYMLTGMIHCTGCGKRYIAHTNSSTRSGTKHVYYICPTNRSERCRCGNSLNVKKLDYLIWQELCSVLTPEVILRELEAKVQKQNEENKLLNAKRKDFEKQLQAKEKEKNNIFHQLGQQGEGFEKLVQEYNNQLSSILSDIAD